MIFSYPNKDALPSLSETLDILKNGMKSLPKMQRYPFEEESDKPFILTKTTSMYSIKPNIMDSSCLFMGTPEFIPELRGKWWNFNKPHFMIQNVIQEEMRIIMESHPFYKLLQDGMDGVRVFNPYGIGMAYGHPTIMLPLTSDIDIAAYYASHAVDLWSDKGASVSISENKTGILYVFELRMPMSYTPGLTTIGKQPFKRSGNSKMFGFDTNPNMNFNDLPFVKGFEFKQSKKDTIELEDRLKQNGIELFPYELITDKFAQLKREKVVSKEAIRRNLRNNPGDKYDENVRILEDNGYEVVDNLDLKFTDCELNEIWYDNVDERWLEFWKDVAFVNLRPSIGDMILDLPNNSKYKDYFVRRCENG